MNSDALAFLASKGLSLDEIIEFARLSERKKDSTNAERQARHRAKRKSENVTRYNNGVTPPIDNTHTPSPDISSDEESQDTRADCETVMAAWNEMAAANDLPACAKLTGARLKSCQARLRSDGLDAILRAIERIPKSDFLSGRSGNWAGANINFLLRPDTVTKILEGQYDDRKQQRNDQNIRPSNGNGPDRRSSLTRACDEALDFLR